MHRGRVRADEHRARVAHERDEQVGVGAHELEVLGRDRVRGVERAAPRRRRRSRGRRRRASTRLRRARSAATSSASSARSTRSATASSHTISATAPPGPCSACARRSTATHAGIDGVVGDDRDLGRAREPVDARPCRTPGASPRRRTRCRARRSTSTGRSAPGAERHRRDRLRAADRVHLVDAGDRRGREDRVVDVRRSGRAASTARPRARRRRAPAAPSSAPTTPAARGRRARSSRRDRRARRARSPRRRGVRGAASRSCCASCHATIWSRASSSAARSPGEMRSSAAAISAGSTRGSATSTPSSRAVSSRTATAPRRADVGDDRRRPRRATSGPSASGRARTRAQVAGSAADVDTSEHGSGSSYRSALAAPARIRRPIRGMAHCPR